MNTENYKQQQLIMSKTAQQFTHFILDTNILFKYPGIISFLSLQNKQIIIPFVAAKEIMDIKDNNNHRIHAIAQKVYAYMNKAIASDPCMVQNVEESDMKNLPPEYKITGYKPEHCILALAIKYKLKGEKICLISDDKGMHSAVSVLPPEEKPVILRLDDFYEK